MTTPLTEGELSGAWASQPPADGVSEESSTAAVLIGCVHFLDAAVAGVGAHSLWLFLKIR